MDIELCKTPEERIENIKRLWKMLRDENKQLKRDLNDCRNELCLRCGSYREKHLGACDGCRWKEVN